VKDWGSTVFYCDLVKAAQVGQSVCSDARNSAYQLRVAINRALEIAEVPATVKNVWAYGYKIVAVLPS
jgi:hypothetical protein